MRLPGLRPIQGLVEVGDYIVRMLSADAETYQVRRFPRRLTALLALLLVSGNSGDIRDRFYSPEICRSPNPLKSIEHPSRLLVTVLHQEAQKMTVAIDPSAVHLVVLAVH